MSKDFARFVDHCNPILANLFDERSVSSDPSYIVSAIFELRRTLGPGDSFVAPTLESWELPDWLGHGLGLGPYERKALTDFARIERPIALFRGGTGSGKTTLLNCLERYATSVTPTLLSQRQWREAWKPRTFFAVLDLLSLPKTLHEARSASAEPGLQTVQLEALQKEAADIAACALEASVCNQTESLDLFADAVWGDIPGGRVGIVETTRHALRQTCGERAQWDHANRQERVALRRNALLGLRSPHHYLIASLLPFVVLAERLRNAGLPFFLVFDNVDPLPGYLQARFFDALHEMTLNGWLQESGLRIVTSLRLSSAMNHISTLDVSVPLTHACPDPADIVFLRLTRFFLGAEEPRGMRALDTSLRRQLYRRLVLLWFRLADRRERFPSLFSAVAGTNIRHALVRARAWCLSPHQDFSAMSEPELEEFRAMLPPAVGRSLMQLIGAATGRTVQHLLGNPSLASRVDVFGRDRVLNEIALEAADVMFDMLRDTCLFEAATPNASGTRPFIAGRIRDGFEAYVQSLGKRPVRPHDTVLATLLTSTRPAGLDPFAAFELGIEFIDALAAVAPMRWATRASELGTTPGPVASYILRWVTETGRHIFGGRAEVVPSRNDGGDMFRPHGRFSHFLRSPNRYDSARMVFESVVPGQTQSARVVNVFSPDGERVCPVILRALYLLSERSRLGPLSIKTLFEDLTRHGYEMSEIVGAWHQVVHPDVRLMYSTVNDHFLGFDRVIQENASHIGMSWAGHLYQQELVRSAVYIQWALSHIRTLRLATTMIDAKAGRPVRLRDRLRATRISLTDVIDDESRRITKAQKDVGPRYFAATQLSVQSASIDIFFHTLDEFLAALASRVHESFEDANDAKQESEERWMEARAWTWAGRQFVQAQRALFDSVPPRWEETLLHAERAVAQFEGWEKRVHRARRE